MENKTWNSGEPSQQWPTYRNMLYTLSTEKKNKSPSLQRRVKLAFKDWINHLFSSWILSALQEKQRKVEGLGVNWLALDLSWVKGTSASRVEMSTGSYVLFLNSLISALTLRCRSFYEYHCGLYA